jgi:nucleotide-binding universal stress UspA family protein
MDRVIVPLNGSSTDEQSLVLGQVLAATLNGALELARLPPQPFGAESVMRADSRDTALDLESVVARLSATLPVSTVWLSGDPRADILGLATERAGVTVVIPVGQPGEATDWMSTSLAMDIIQQVPVLLFPTLRTRRWDRIQHLVIPLDRSPVSETALQRATALAVAPGASTSLVRVITSDEPAASADECDAIAVEADRLIEARTYLKRCADNLRRHGLTVGWEVRSGQPGDEIVRMIQTTQADLLIIAARSREHVDPGALGPVTEALVERSPIPILVIPPSSSASLSSEARHRSQGAAAVDAECHRSGASGMCQGGGVRDFP